MGSKESVVAKIDADTRLKIEEMNEMMKVNRQALITELLAMVYDIKPQMHRNYALQLEAAKGNY